MTSLADHEDPGPTARAQHAEGAISRIPTPGVVERLCRALGFRRGFKQGAFYYKETSPISLRHALSRQGPGQKQYRVTFPDGTKMLIHCAVNRVYADLMGTPVLDALSPLWPSVRPGMRVLALNAGTGHIADKLARLVGPSGAVVALEPDAESVAFAHKRYPHANTAHEQGAAEQLAGETDNAFDRALCINPEHAPDERTVRECWRVLRPGGVLAVLVPNEHAEPAVSTLASLIDHGEDAEEIEHLPSTSPAHTLVHARKPDQ